MSAIKARVLRSTLTRCTSLNVAPNRIVTKSLFQTQSRCASSASVRTVEENSTAGEAMHPDVGNARQESTDPIHKDEKVPSTMGVETPVFEELVGRNQSARAKQSHADMRTLQKELKMVYNAQRLNRNTLNSTYKVRELTEYHRLDPSIKVENMNVHLDGKRIPNIWLRDNCPCSSCMHGETKQRLADTFSIPNDIHIRNYKLNLLPQEQVQAQAQHQNQDATSGSTLEITWSDGHESTYKSDVLKRALDPQEHRSVLRQGLLNLTLWDFSIASRPPKLDYASIMSREQVHLRPLLERLRSYGFCYVDNTPFKHPTYTRRLLESISFIRETHYGGFYDFTADLASKDTAYTNIALEAHTDTTYFSDPAGLQAFHLLSHTHGEGGASLLVDGFKVARELYATDQQAYHILSTVNVHGHASGNAGISIQPYRGFPVLEHDPATGELLRVRWNSSDRASIDMPIEDVEKWYDAARKFDALLKKKENEYWEQLVPGRVLIFDNWRVLHGRSAFTGKRRICGGYINRDDWISKFKMLHFGSEKVLDALPVS